MDYTPLSTPSPLLVFPSASPTPKLSCTPSKKPPSPFDWPTECLLDGDQQNTTPSPPPLLTRRHSCTSTLRKNIAPSPRPASIIITSPAPPPSTNATTPPPASSLSQNRMLGNWFMRMKRAAEKPFRMIG